MEVMDALDREVIIERAETVRSWLASFSLSGRATTALERELAGIIADDPGGYINGRRPLAGLTIDDVIAELDLPNAGAVGQVRGVGDRVIAELRAAIAPDGELGAASAPADLAPAAASAMAAPGNGVVPDAGALAAPDAAEPEPEASEPAAPQPARRGPGRPRRKAPVEPVVTAAPAQMTEAVAPAPEPQADQPEAADAAEIVAPPRARRGRPRKTASPTFSATATAQPLASPSSAPVLPAAEAGAGPLPVTLTPALSAATADDPTLEQLTRLWPALHPQARRAVVLYVSMLLVEI